MDLGNYISEILVSEAALQTCSLEKVFWKYAANLQENTHAERVVLNISFTPLKIKFSQMR